VILTQKFNGEVPQTFAELISLPGVGEYTANAILAFAFGQRSLVLDVNVRRLLARAWLGQSHQAPTISAIERVLAENLLPIGDQHAATWSAASMELGALICTAREPLCAQCPIVNDCNWFSQGKPNSGIPKKVQPRYEGSLRQERGRILKILREHKSSTSLEQIVHQSPDRQRCETALTQLLNEGMIEKTRGRYALPSS
jgi:A/G-specific adenine glycosylase